MIITVKKNEEVIYHQMTEDSKTLNAVVGFLMQQPPGKELVTSVANNGQALTFSTGAFPIEPFVRKVNGIVVKKPAEKKGE